MSILDTIFGKTAPTNTGTNESTTAADTKTSADNTAPADDKAANKSPMDQFTQLFQDTPDDTGNDTKSSPDNTKQTTKVNPFETDVKKLYQVAQSIDFSKTIDDATLEKIRAGGDGAQEAVITAMNTVGQMVYAYSAMHSAHAAKLAVQEAINGAEGKVPDIVRRLLADHDLSDSHPALNHPAAQPMIRALTAQFAERFPNESPKAIQKKVKEYIINFADLVKDEKNDTDGIGLRSKVGEDGKRKQPQEQDWTKFLNG